MGPSSKRIRKLLREHTALAYEAELNRALAPLAQAFEQWKSGELSPHDLSDLIHAFHQGPARDLYVRYTGEPGMQDVLVAHALASGILDKEKVPRELLDHLRSQIEYWEQRETPAPDEA